MEVVMVTDGNGNGNGHSQAGSLTVPASSSSPKELESIDRMEKRKAHLAVLHPKIKSYYEIPEIVLTSNQCALYHELGAANGHLVQSPANLDVNLPLNSPCAIISEGRRVLAVYRGNGSFSHVPRPPKPEERPRGFFPKNEEQAFANYFINDFSVRCLLLHGPAGVGKSIMILNHIAAHHARYEKIYLIKQACPMGEDEGFLPGESEDKFSPYGESFNDNFEMLSEYYPKLFDLLMKREDPSPLRSKIVVCSPRGFRGRKVHGCLIYFDEIQNARFDLGHGMATRPAGSGARFFASGDLDQIDLNKARRLDANALFSLLEDTRGEEECAQLGMLMNEQGVPFVSMLTRKLSARNRKLSESNYR